MAPGSDAQSNIGSFVDDPESLASKRAYGITRPAEKVPEAIQTQPEANNVVFGVGKRIVSASISAEAAKALKEDILNTIDEIDGTVDRVYGGKRVSRVSLPYLPEIGAFVIKKKNGETIVVDSDDAPVRLRRRMIATVNDDTRIDNQKNDKVQKQANVVKRVAPLAVMPKAPVMVDHDVGEEEVADEEPEMPHRAAQMAPKSKKQLKREAKQHQKEQERVNTDPPPRKDVDVEESGFSCKSGNTADESRRQ